MKNRLQHFEPIHIGIIIHLAVFILIISDRSAVSVSMVKDNNLIAEIIGIWSNDIWYWDKSESKWTKMASGMHTGDVAAGGFTGDGIADVASCWDNGLWYQDGSTLGWTKISDSAPNQVTAGDVTGD